MESEARGRPLKLLETWLRKVHVMTAGKGLGLAPRLSWQARLENFKLLHAGVTRWVEK